MNNNDDLPTLPLPAFARDLQGDAPVFTEAQLRECILADRLARSSNPAPAEQEVQPVVDKDARLGRYVKEFATKGGWDPDDGEGAFEFVQRHSYVVGIEDAGGTVGPYGTQTHGSRWPVSAFAKATDPTVTTSIEQRGIAIGAGDPESFFAKLCALEEYPSEEKMTAALRSAFYEGIRYCALQPHSAAPKGAVELTVWEGPMPESNGKSNFTAVLMRKGADLLDGINGGFTIARSEYPGRVRYEADCVRHLVGELAKEPFILDYDSEQHSGYTAPEAPDWRAIAEGHASEASALRAELETLKDAAAGAVADYKMDQKGLT